MNMNNATFWFSLIGFVLAAGIAAGLIILWKKGYLTSDVIKAIKDMADGLILPEGTLLGTLSYYCRLAVLAVEQLVKSGQLEKDDAARREKAMEIVEQYATTDGFELGESEKAAVKSLIEVEVYELRNAQANGTVVQTETESKG